MKFKYADEQQLSVFKERIGFDKIVDDPNLDVGIVVDWDGVVEFLPSRESGWELFSESVSSPDGFGSISREWSFRRGEGFVTVKILVSSVGFTEARNQLLADATATSMPEIPYIRGPAKLGQLSIRHPREPLESVRWVFHNVYVKIRGDDTGISMEPLARSIQEFMERHVKQHVSQHLPVIDKVTVSRTLLQVGQEVEVGAHPRDLRNLKNLKINIEAPFEELGLVRQTQTSKLFRGLRSGKTTVDVRMADVKTLLMSHARAHVDIEPAR